MSTTWETVAERIAEWVPCCSLLSGQIKQAVALVPTVGDVGIYWQPEIGQAGLYWRGSNPADEAQDLAVIKMAVARVVGEDHFRERPLNALVVSEEPWVKVAYSPSLRRAGELLNFFPGRYPGGIPNAPSPLAATLTGGLAGAGLGYGVGWLGEKLLPEDWQRDKLRRTLAVLGGAVGAAPGAIWSASALRRGKGLIHNNDLAGFDPGAFSEKVSEALDLVTPDELAIAAGQRFCKLAWGEDDAAGASFQPQLPPAPETVQLDAMGHVLWNAGADPRTSATTMGALYAAQQMSDPHAQEGEVTPHQMGLLGTMMGAAGGGIAGYLAGTVVGKTLGVLTGMPTATQQTLSQGGALLGVINAVVPRLFH